MTQDVIEEIELEINAAKELVELGDALARLSKNKDFVTVITENYFKGEAARLVMAKASPAMRHPDQQEGVTKSIDAIGQLYQYFFKVQTQANQARDSIAESEQAIEDLAEGELS